MALVTYPLNGIDYQAEDAERYSCTRTSGVFSAEDNFRVEAIGGMQVTVGKGLAWIKNSEFAGKSIANTDTVTLTVPLADGTKKRIDRVVLRFDKAANRSEILVKTGVASNTPVAPSVDRTELVYELGLYTINVGAAVTEITPSDITSTLLDEKVCGLMRDGVTGIPTAQLQEQVVDLLADLRKSFENQLTAQGNEFDTWFEEIKGQLSTDVAGNLQNQIDDLEEVVDGVAGGLPYFAGTGTSVAVRSAANRIENVTSHGYTEQSGSGDPSPTNVRPITVGGLNLMELVINSSEVWAKSSDSKADSFYFTNKKINKNSKVFCYGYKNVTDRSVPSVYVDGFNAVVFSVSQYGKTTLEQWKEELQKNPITVYVEPVDQTNATGIYTQQISDGEEYRCNCIELQQHLCEGDTLDSNIPSGCDKMVVFDGSEDENWTTTTTNTSGTVRFLLRGALKGIGAVSSTNVFPGFSSWLTPLSASDTFAKIQGISVSSEDESVVIYLDDLNTSESLNDFKTKLSNYPLTVYYRSTEYPPQKNIKVCMEKHVRGYIVVDGTTVMLEQGIDAYKVMLTNAQNGVVKCNRFSNLTIASNIVTIPASQFPVEVTNLQQANEWAKTNNVQLEYALSSPAVYANNPVELPAYPITTASQATLLTQQGEVGTYTVSGEKTISVYLKPMQDGGNAETVQGYEPSDLINCNPNLLDNSLFSDPINQRGQNFYEASAGQNKACIDRWIIQGGTYNTQTKIFTGISSPNEYGCYIRQALEGRILNVGDRITFSAKINNEVFSFTEQLRQMSGDSSATQPFSVQKTWGGVKIYKTDDEIIVAIYANASTSITIDWVKLETGNQATAYVGKSKPEELLNCYRYYYVVDVRVRQNTTSSDYPDILTVSFPTEMRIVPTVTLQKSYGNDLTAAANYRQFATLTLPARTAFVDGAYKLIANSDYA